MVGGNEEEIYSIMFKSLKHPVRRRILGMLNDKPLPFMEMVELLGVSSSHLTYHLESLGELVCKTDNGLYQLSSFGKATVSAMKGVQEAPELANRHPKKLAKKWKTAIVVLMVAVLLLSSFGIYQYYTINQLAANQSNLEAENQQLLSWGIGASKAANMMRDVVRIDTNRYKIILLSNTLEYRDDFNVAEEVLKYSFTSTEGSLNVSLRFRENHLSRYQLTADSKPLVKANQPNSILDLSKEALDLYSNYSGDAYLTKMRSLLNSVNATSTEAIIVSSGNLKLQITSFGTSAEFLWLYAENGVDYSAKSLRMTFNNDVLTALTDGYFLFTIANTNLTFNSSQAEAAAKSHVEAMTWTINGTETSDLKVQNIVSVQMLPHPRGTSVALIPYWYVVMNLDKTYAGGFNEVAVGVWADNGDVADVQLLSG